MKLVTLKPKNSKGSDEGDEIFGWVFLDGKVRIANIKLSILIYLLSYRYSISVV